MLAKLITPSNDLDSVMSGTVCSHGFQRTAGILTLHLTSRDVIPPSHILIRNPLLIISALSAVN